MLVALDLPLIRIDSWFVASPNGSRPHENHIPNDSDDCVERLGKAVEFNLLEL